MSFVRSCMALIWSDLNHCDKLRRLWVTWLVCECLLRKTKKKKGFIYVRSNLSQCLLRVSFTPMLHSDSSLSLAQRVKVHLDDSILNLVAATSTQVHTMRSHTSVGGYLRLTSRISWLWLGSANWCWAKPTHRLTLPAVGASSTWGQWLLRAWGGLAPEARAG